MRRVAAVMALFWLGASSAGCKDLSRFSTAAGEYYCGQIVDAQFVRRGFGGSDAGSVWMRMTLDTAHISDAPGTLSTSDGLLAGVPMRPLPELFNDPLSTLAFGEGRDKNLLFAVDPADPSRGPTILAFISLMHAGGAEVRLVRGAPSSNGPADAGTVDGPPLFGVFAPLDLVEKSSHHPPECSF